MLYACSEHQMKTAINLLFSMQSSSSYNWWYTKEYCFLRCNGL